MAERTRRTTRRNGTTTLALLCAALSLGQGCACDTVPASAVQDCQATQVLPDKVQTDILFVIDDSGSMSDNQANLANSLGVFIAALAASAVENDFRIGVTNTSIEGFLTSPTSTPVQAYAGGPSSGDPYPDGAILAVAQSGGQPSPLAGGNFIYDTTLYPLTAGWGGSRFLDKGLATLQQDFKVNVLVGTRGSGREQPFRAARLALTSRVADANAGFLRPGARLAVFFLTDEDDCSGDPSSAVSSDTQCHDLAVKNDPALMDGVADFAAFLLGPIDGELRQVNVGAIAGFDPATLQPSCGTCANRGCGSALEQADRFDQLLTALGDARMQVGSICVPDFSAALLRFAQQLTPSSLPLQGTPADWRLLAVKLTKVGGAVIPCTVALDATPEAPAAGAIYSPPGFGRPAQLTFQNACTLGLGDRIDVSIVCAG
jgi:hypothetical protein